MARQFTSIYNTRQKKGTVNKKINEWIKKVENKGVTCFNGFIETLKKHQHYIINYFEERHSSGFVEGLNNKLKVIKRRCYGLYNLKNFFQRVFLDLQGYKLFVQNQEVNA